MMTPDQIIDNGRQVLRIEAQAVEALIDRIDERFALAVSTIRECRGRLIVTGVGKSGLIARKIVATMNSTGTPAFFLHPSDAVHGDLGMVTHNDAVLILSKSGDTEEIKTIMPIFRRMDVPVIAMLGNVHSSLAASADIVLDAGVVEEACPYDLAPTASTTASLALGDALAIALLQMRGFKPEDFALFHPGGMLGRKLLLRVDDIMATGSAVPVVHQAVSLRDAILEMTTKRLGATCVVDDDRRLVGVITDGDLRRMLEKDTDMTALRAVDVMSASPKTLAPDALVSRALEVMEQFKITQLIIADGDRQPVGIVHMHDLVQLGLRPERDSR